MSYDVIVVGGGVVGMTAALLLAKNTALKIAVIEEKTPSLNWKPEQYDHRVSAISLASKNIFQQIHLWDEIKNKRINPYAEMHVWDAGSSGEIHFDCKEVNKEALGYIVEDSVMRSCLLEKCRTNLDFLSPLKLISLQENPNCIELQTGDQKTITTKLLIAADGANSWVREQVNIELKTWDYNHIAIVTTVETELSHQKTAWQRFLPTGPLAFLPLDNENFSSIVWSVIPSKAEKLLSLDDENFSVELENAFEKKLGKIQSIEKRFSFPLRMRHAKNYVKPRIALIGDAAHTLHPLAGQGVNLGLADAAFLSEVILEASKKERDFSSFHTLRRYERSRKSANFTMLAFVEFLKHLFGSDKKALKIMREIGLNMTNRTSLLKNFFVDCTLGE